MGCPRVEPNHVRGTGEGCASPLPGQTSSCVPPIPTCTNEYVPLRIVVALVSVASKVIGNSSYAGPEASVLRLGVDALEKVFEQLDEADSALGRFLEKKADAKGGEV